VLGPRHLTPLIPFLVAPLAIGIAWCRKQGWLSGVAGGLCAASIVVTGVASVTYPHIPEEFTGAIAHLIWPLLKGGYLPYNLAEVMTGRVGLGTWVPWYTALSFIALVALWRCLDEAKAALIAVVVVAAHVAILFLAVPPISAQETQTQRWIMKTWEPTPANVKRGLMR
jgi:hypothetical protein